MRARNPLDRARQPGRKFQIKQVWHALRAWLRDPRVVYQRETANLRTRVEARRGLPFLLIPILLGWYIASPQGVVTMALAAIAGALLVDFYWALSLARSVRGQRKLIYTAMQVGDELQEEIRVVNGHAFIPALWVEFADRSNVPGYTISSVWGVSAGSVSSWKERTICSRRGVYTLGPWELHMGTPLGIFLVRQVYLQKQEVLVYPPIANLPERIFAHRGSQGDARPLNQPLPAETISSSSARAYVPGDPLHHIHWPTTARKNEPFVKVFAPEASSNIWLVPDFDAQAHVHSGEDFSLETMITVTASLAAVLLNQRLAVGLFASGSPELADDRVALPRRGQPYLWNILQALAPLQAVPDRPLESVLARAGALVGSSDLIVVISPSLRPEWAATLRLLAKSRYGSTRAEVILIDPASFSPGDELQGQAERMAAYLYGQGIRTEILRREEVHLIKEYYGALNRWEFKVSGSGRAVVKRTPLPAEHFTPMPAPGKVKS